MTLFIPLLVFLLFSGSIAALLLAVFYPYVSRSSKIDRRAQSLALAAPSANTTADRARKRSIDEILREAAERQKAREKKRTRPTLLARIRQADLKWNKKTYYVFGVAAGVACLALLRLGLGLGALTAAGFGVATGLLLPHLFVSFKRNARFKRFSAEFPNALDVIVRGVKSGLPLIDCIEIISTEAQDPVKGEFRTIVQDQAIGVPLDQAVERLPDRIPLPEANFFAIVISLQSQTGGSLSEALGNLSTVLRERKKMKGRIKALSSESKASAMIIGSMPIVVSGLIYLTTPQYMSLLFVTQIGKMVLAASALWMIFGSLIMRKMINFDF